VKYRYHLSLGSNIDREANLPAAVRLLGTLGRVEAVSRVYETPPVGMAPGTAAFFNAAVRLAADLAPDVLKERIRQEVEVALGRRPGPAGRWRSRPIDVDLVLGLDDRGRPVAGPDPDITAWLHVARPLADLDPDLVVPGEGRTLAGIARDLERSQPLPALRPDVILQT